MSIDLQKHPLLNLYVVVEVNEGGAPTYFRSLPLKRVTGNPLLKASLFATYENALSIRQSVEQRVRIIKLSVAIKEWVWHEIYRLYEADRTLKRVPYYDKRSNKEAVMSYFTRVWRKQRNESIREVMRWMSIESICKHVDLVGKEEFPTRKLKPTPSDAQLHSQQP